MTIKFGCFPQGGEGEPLSSRALERHDGTQEALQPGEFLFETDDPVLLEARERWRLGPSQTVILDDTADAYLAALESLDEYILELYEQPIVINGVSVRRTIRDNRFFDDAANALTTGTPWPANGVPIVLADGTRRRISETEFQLLLKSIAEFSIAVRNEGDVALTDIETNANNQAWLENFDPSTYSWP